MPDRLMSEVELQTSSTSHSSVILVSHISQLQWMRKDDALPKLQLVTQDVRWRGGSVYSPWACMIDNISNTLYQVRTIRQWAKRDV